MWGETAWRRPHDEGARKQATCVTTLNLKRTPCLEEEFEGVKFRVTTGDYQELLQSVCDNLIEASKHSANELEKNMFCNKQI